MSTASAKGQRFERLVADYLALALGDTRIDIRPKNGTNDRGDIGGIRTIRGADVVIEAKNHAKLNLGGWMTEAEIECGNASASAGVVAHKRARKGQGGDQWVTMTLETFAWLLKGGPDDEPVVIYDPMTVTS